jgi:hypothetical protein
MGLIDGRFLTEEKLNRQKHRNNQRDPCEGSDNVVYRKTLHQ